jgi:hypothetical protein
MTMIVEDGSGIVNANALATEVFVDTYFNDRGIATWTGTTTVKENAIIKATDYLNKRFSTRFRGQIKVISSNAAKSVLTFTALPSANETVTIDGTVFTFKTTASLTNEVTIAARISDTIDNLILVINESGIDYCADINPGLSMVVQADFDGEDGNTIAVSTDTTATWSFSTLNGGNDENRGQALPFPRLYLYTDTGTTVLGVPQGVKEAVAEYALRALTADLMDDPTLDDAGNTIKRKKEKIGPIEEETEYQIGASTALKSYPAADRLLLPYVNAGGGVFR